MAASRVFILSLDGADLSRLADYGLPAFASLLGSSCGHREQAEGLYVDRLAVWSEVMSGRLWTETGCAAFCRPDISLDRSHVFTEQDLPATILSMVSADELISINFPLVLPLAGRRWLAGGLPYDSRTVSPGTLALAMPFSDYRPRPFQSISYALADRLSASADIVSGELRRIDCLEALIAQGNWRLCLARIDCIDLLLHLWGDRLAPGSGLAVSAAIKDALDLIDRRLSAIVSSLEDTLTVVVSAFSHVPCLARVSLNQMLVSGGFARPMEETAAPGSALERRRQATAAVRGLAGELSQTAPLVSPDFRPDLPSTSAYSPCAGAVYINTRDRFAGGCVDASERESLVRAVREHLTDTFVRSGIGLQSVWQNDKESSDCSVLPDLLLSAPGVEFHNLPAIAAIDFRDKPGTTHMMRPALCLPHESSAGSSRPLLSVYRHCADVLL